MRIERSDKRRLEWALLVGAQVGYAAGHGYFIYLNALEESMPGYFATKAEALEAAIDHYERHEETHET